MLAYVVGPVDLNSAAVLISFFSMLTIIGAIWFAKRRSRLEIDNDFQLAKIKESAAQNYTRQKQSDAHDENEFKLETDRILKMGQLEKGLITSHSRKDREQED